MSFIAAHADRRTDDGLRWGVEPICRVLTKHGTPIAPSTYYDAHGRTTARALRDEQFKTEVARVHAANYGSTAPGRCGWRSTAKASRWPGAPSSG